MNEYEVCYKDTENKTWDEWREQAGFNLKEAEEVKKRVEAIPTTYDVEIRIAKGHYE